MDFEDRRGQLLRILPKDLRKEAFRRLTDFKTVSSLKEWVREQLEYERDWGTVDKGSVAARAVEVTHEDLQLENESQLRAQDVHDLLAIGAEGSTTPTHIHSRTGQHSS